MQLKSATMSPLYPIRQRVKREGGIEISPHEIIGGRLDGRAIESIAGRADLKKDDIKPHGDRTVEDGIGFAAQSLLRQPRSRWPVDIGDRSDPDASHLALHQFLGHLLRQKGD